MDFKGRKLGKLWQCCGGLWQPSPGPKEEVSKFGGSNIRVLKARGLAGLAGLAGRRMEPRSLARSMLWRDRRIFKKRNNPGSLTRAQLIIPTGAEPYWDQFARGVREK